MHFSDVEACSGRPDLDAVFARAPKLAYSIGGIRVALFARSELKLKLDHELLPFAVEAANPDICINVDWAEHIAVPSCPPVFHSGGLWSLFEEDDGYRFYFSTPFLGAAPYKSAWFDADFRCGQILLYRRYYDALRAVNPLEYPLDELLAIHHLSCAGGIEVHAVGVIDANDRGHLLLGHSGAGKSTSARLWQQRPGTRVLSDDRIILRERQGRIRMFGTPWHGDAGLALPDSADLSAMYVLQHGNRNEITPLPAGRAAAELLARSFVPHHSSRGLKSTLHALEHITREVPCSLFQFVPDQTSVEAVCHA